MGLILHAAVVGRKVIAKAEGTKPAFCAYLCKCPETGLDFEVASSSKIGKQGEIIDLPVRAEVNKMGKVSFKPVKDSGFETDWDDDDVPASSVPSSSVLPSSLSKPPVTNLPPMPLPTSDQARLAASLNGNKS